MGQPDYPDDDALLAAIQRGDREAIIAAYERHFTSLYRYAHFKTGDASAAEDVVSDVFVTLIRSVGTRRAPQRHLRGWLFQVVRSRLAVPHPPPNVPLGDVEDWMPAAPESNPEIAFSQAFDVQRVRRALHLLTTDHQEVLHLRFGQRLSLQETADLMGKSVSAIKSLQFRAVETLRGILSDAKPETTHG